MAEAAAVGSDQAVVVEGYEALRAAVVGGMAEGWRHGYGILVAGGMAAWMAAWASGGLPAAGTPAPSADPSTPIPSTPTTEPSPLSSLRNAGEIVSVVAQMALAHL